MLRWVMNKEELALSLEVVIGERNSSPLICKMGLSETSF